MLTGYVFILAAAISWGFIGIFSAVAFSQGLGPMEIAFWRAIPAWCCFGGQAFWCGQTKVKKQDLPLLAVFGISLFYISYQYAVKSGGAAFAAVLLYTAPAWVVAFSFLIYQEKLTAIR